MSVQGDEEEKATPIPDLKNLLIECEVGNGKGSKVVDSKILKRAADTVKAYLKSDPGKVDDLLECDEFAGFLVQCLKQGENNSSLQFSAVWIFDVILTKGSDNLVRAVLDPDILAVPWLLKLLQSRDRTIYDKASKVLAELTTFDEAYPQLFSNSTAIFTSLGKLLQSKKISQDFSLCAAEIVIRMVFNASGFRQRLDMVFRRRCSYNSNLVTEQVDQVAAEVYNNFSKAPIEEFKLTPRVLKQALRVLPQLLELDGLSHKLRKGLLQCLMCAAISLNDVKPVIESGCCSKIAACLSDPDDSIAFGAALIIGWIARSGEQEFIDFLRSCKEPGGLENISRVVTIDMKRFPELSKIVEHIMTAVSIVIHRNSFNEGIRLSVNSGVIDALIFCVKEPNVPPLFKGAALSILDCLINQLDVSRRSFCAVILPHVLDLIKATPVEEDAQYRFQCMRILHRLVERNVERRDYALTLKAQTVLLKLLQNPDQLSEKERLPILMCLKTMIEVVPLAHIEEFKMVPSVMHLFFRDAGTLVEQEISVGFEVLAAILKYETREIADMVFPVYFSVNLVAYFRASSHKLHPCLLQGFIEVTSKLVTLGSASRRKEMLHSGVLEGIKETLLAGCDKSKVLALETLRFLTENTKLSVSERVQVLALEPLVTKEKTGNVLECQCVAKCVLKKMTSMKASAAVSKGA